MLLGDEFFSNVRRRDAHAAAQLSAIWAAASHRPLFRLPATSGIMGNCISGPNENDIVATRNDYELVGRQLFVVVATTRWLQHYCNAKQQRCDSWSRNRKPPPPPPAARLRLAAAHSPSNSAVDAAAGHPR